MDWISVPAAVIILMNLCNMPVSPQSVPVVPDDIKAPNKQLGSKSLGEILSNDIKSPKLDKKALEQVMHIYRELRNELSDLDNDAYETIIQQLGGRFHFDLGEIDPDLPNVNLTQAEIDAVFRHRLQDTAYKLIDTQLLTVGEAFYAKDSERLTHTINSLMDSIITVIKIKVQSQLPIPEIHRNISYKLGFMKTTVKFDGWDGYVEDMHTLERRGDCKMEHIGDEDQLELKLGFTKLEIHFAKYKLKTFGISHSGRMKAKVHGNAFLLNVGLRKTTTECHVVLNSFQLTQFGKIKITMSGGFLGKVQSVITTWILKLFRNRIRTIIEEHVSYMIRRELTKHESEVCSIFKQTK